jgi:hypothetical protein
VSLNQARGARWIAVGDWNRDGSLDLASANLFTGTFTIFAGNGAGAFTLTQSLPSGRQHTIEAVDYDGDGILDLALGEGSPGVRLHQGSADGKFAYLTNVTTLGCVNYLATGDFDGDGRGDLAPTCLEEPTAYAGVSLGDGNYRQTLRDPFAAGTESSAVADLNGDGQDDLALVSQGSTLLKVYLGTGDGSFEPPRSFAATGGTPEFLIARDLDGDGRPDVVSCDRASSTLTIFFGQEGERFLQTEDGVAGLGDAARAFAVADFEEDGAPDLFFAGLTRAKVFVYLAPGGSSPASPSLTVDMDSKLTALIVEDLNGDGIPDLAGANQVAGTAVVALLDRAGMAVAETAIPCGDSPADIRVGALDEDASPDLALPVPRANEIAILRQEQEGVFGPPTRLASAGNPTRLALGDVDGDGRLDIAAIGTTLAALHYGLGDERFSAPVPLAEDPARNLADVVLADVTGDGLPDVLVGETRTSSVFLHPGRGERAFGDAIPIAMGISVTGVFPADVDGDDRLDITASGLASQAVAIAYQTTDGKFTNSAVHRVGLGPALHRVSDMNRDAVPDIVALGSTGAAIRLGSRDGAAGRLFRRGDADGNGKVEINDPVFVLNHLFATGGPLPCPDAADADDTGTINLTDAVWTLRWLFLGGPPPAPPGPAVCGADPGVDGLPADCRGGPGCR